MGLAAPGPADGSRLGRTGLAGVRGSVRPRSRPNLDGQFNLLIELAQDHNRVIDREALKLHVANARKLGRRNACHPFGCADAQRASIEHADDLGGQDGARLLKVGIRMPKSGKTLPRPRTIDLLLTK
jgi:hypothetical protein